MGFNFVFLPRPPKKKVNFLEEGIQGEVNLKETLSPNLIEGPSGSQPRALPLCLSSVSMGPHVQIGEYNSPVRTHLLTMPLIREKLPFLNSPFILIL